MQQKRGEIIKRQAANIKEKQNKLICLLFVEQQKLN